MNKSAPLAIQDVSPAQKGGGRSKAIKGKGNKGKADKGKGTKGGIKTRRVFATTLSHAGAKTPTARGFTLAQDATQPTFPTPVAFALQQPDISLVILTSLHSCRPPTL